MARRNIYPRLEIRSWLKVLEHSCGGLGITEGPFRRAGPWNKAWVGAEDRKEALIEGPRLRTSPIHQLDFPEAPWIRTWSRSGMRLVVPVSPKVSGPVIHWSTKQFLAALPPQISSWSLWVGPGQPEKGWMK